MRIEEVAIIILLNYLDIRKAQNGAGTHHRGLQTPTQFDHTVFVQVTVAMYILSVCRQHWKM